MACNQETEAEWNAFLEDCADKAKKLKQKRKQDAYNKAEAHAQSLYSKYRKDIESDTVIKNAIADAMTHKDTTLNFYTGSGGIAWSPRIHRDWLNEKYFNKVFRSTAYGDKKLLDLLDENFGSSVKITIVKHSWVHNRAKVRLTWKKNKK